MSPYPIVSPPHEEEILAQAVEQEAPALPAELGEKPEVVPGSTKAWLAEALLETSATRPRQQALDMFLSLVLHTIFLGTLILLPLYFTEAIDLKQFTQTFLVAPPPPPPPAPPPSPAIAKIAPPKRVLSVGGKLVAPVVIPKTVAMLKEVELLPEIGVGVVGGVPGGVPGGQAGGVIGGILAGAPRTYVPPAPAATPMAPIRVGGRVKAPREIAKPDPIYPALAKQAKVQGDVILDAVIDTSGNVVEIQVVSGHPLLIPAAIAAVRKWKYEPTYLNEQPVAVQLLVTVRFRLGITP